MGIKIYCDGTGNKLYENVNTDICSISLVKWESTLISCIVLMAIGIYLLRKHKERCHRTLLTFHNLRAAVALLLLLINTLELARTFLQWPTPTVPAPKASSTFSIIGGAAPVQLNAEKNGFTGSNNNFIYPAFNKEKQLKHNAYAEQIATTSQNDKIIVIIGIDTLWNSLSAIFLTFMLMCYHRIVELKKTVEYLYISATFEALICLLRIFEIAEVVHFEEIYELESCLQSLTATCLLALCIIDGFTVYKERYRPDYIEDYDKIGYKHTLATFYSKICFWWLTPMLWFGYKEPLELEDLGQMRLEDSARAHYDRFLLIYKTAKVKNTTGRPSLWLCYIKYSWRLFALGGVLKLFGDLFALIGPLAIQQIVQYIETMYVDKFYKNSENNTNNNTDSTIRYKPNNISIVLRESVRNIATTYNKNSYYGNNGSIDESGRKYSRIHTIAKLWLSQNIVNNNNAIESNYQRSYSHFWGHSAQNDLYSDNYVLDMKIHYTSWVDFLGNGWVIAWIALLAAFAQGGLSQASTHMLNMTGIRIKTSLQGLIYRKTLLLQSNFLHIGNGRVLNDVDKLSENANVRTADSNKMQQRDILNETIKNNCSAYAVQNKRGQQQRVLNQIYGNDLSDVGAITNLMSEDTLNIMSFFWIAHYVWAIPLKIAVVMYLLYLKLGISAVIGSFVCILTMTPLQFLIGKAIATNTETLAKYTDERLRTLHDTFMGITLVKLNAWDEVFLKKIRGARNKELQYLNKDSIYWTIMTILTHISSVIITFVTLAFYVCFNADISALTASNLFSALALFQQLTVPLLIYPITVPIIISAIISTKRLERFLELREIQKQFEGIRNMARILSKSDASLDMYEINDIKSNSLDNNLLEYDPNKVQEGHILNERLTLRIVVPNQLVPLAHSEPITPICEKSNTYRFQHNLEEIMLSQTANESNDPLQDEKRTSTQRREILRNTPYVAMKPRKLSSTHLLQTRKSDSWHRDSLLLKMSDDVAVSLRDCCFAWNPMTMEGVLNVRDVTIPKGKHTIIVGKNGSGKTSILSALLMEMPLVSGDMIWNKTSTIAFVAQHPWLLNSSIRENIVFGEPFRPKRYDFVLNACALKPDIELMPAADLTIIGERGVNLSGGQRQRIGIARAIYSSANVVIMDDPLSSLDNEVARHILEQSIKRMLLMAKRTVIMVTHQLQLAQQADYVIVLKDLSLQASGTYKEIQMKYPYIIEKWNAIITKTSEQEQQISSNFGRTAQERWKLFKNVTKLGLQRSVSLQTNKIAEAARQHIPRDDNEDMLPEELKVHTALRDSQSIDSFNFSMRRSSVYGSRHLIYEVPLPIDEYQTEDVVMRRRRRSNVRRSSRLSLISTTSTEFQRSQLTGGCSSASIKARNRTSALSFMDENTVQQYQLKPRVQSWQAQSSICETTKQQHKEVARNISLPENFQQTTFIDDASIQFFDSDLNDNIGSSNQNIKNTVGFQQFLRRMSMRRSNKPTTSVVYRKHRPVSDSNSILSISEESTPMQLKTFLPSIELMSIPSNNNFGTAYSTVKQENAESSDETKMNRKMIRLQPAEAKEGIYNESIATTDHCVLQPIRSITTGEETTNTKTNTRKPFNTTMTENNLHEDNERKYGKISRQIYMLYLRTSGVPIVFIFLISAIIWQSLRVYTDVWLQHWTDNKFDTSNQVGIINSLQMTKFNASNSNLRVTNESMPNFLNEFEYGAMQQEEVMYYFIIYGAISCVCIVMAIISTTAGQFAGSNARRTLHDQLLVSILRKTLYFFQITTLGRIMSRFSNDMAIIDKKIAATSQRLLQFSLLCLCAILINVTITPWFIILTLPICGAYYAIQKFYRCSSRELQRIENSTSFPVISHLSETIQGVTTIRAYNQESRFTEILFRRLEANTIAFTILNTSNRWLGISLDYLGGVVVFVAIVTALVAATITCQQHQPIYLYFAAGTKNNKGINVTPSPTPSLVGLAINYTLLIPIYLNWVVKLWADMEMYIGSVERIAYYAEQTTDDPQTMKVTTRSESHNIQKLSKSNEIYTTMGATTDFFHSMHDEINTEYNKSNSNSSLTHVVENATSLATHALGTVMAAMGHINICSQTARRSQQPQLFINNHYKTVPISWPQRGDITFENVSLRYEGQKEDVIKNVILKIPAGQRLAICGRTGSGKSSLALSLFGVLQITSGRIYIDDFDITEIHPDEIRTRLSIIPQDVHLFNATIRENLDPPGYYSDLELWNCLEMAQLKSYVNGQFPLGLDTIIMDGGLNLSGGYRQLFCLARAILRGSVCLILDEASSSLDTATENALLLAAHKAFQGRTIITIAHRLSTILDYDRIIVLENGKIIEDGSPHELQRKSDGIFTMLLHSDRSMSSMSTLNDSGVILNDKVAFKRN